MKNLFVRLENHKKDNNSVFEWMLINLSKENTFCSLHKKITIIVCDGSAWDSWMQMSRKIGTFNWNRIENEENFFKLFLSVLRFISFLLPLLLLDMALKRNSTKREFDKIKQMFRRKRRRRSKTTWQFQTLKAFSVIA